MDNLPAHKGVAVKKAVEADHAKLLYLPKYLPDLNPIEQAFSKLKALQGCRTNLGSGLTI